MSFRILPLEPPYARIVVFLLIREKLDLILVERAS